MSKKNVLFIASTGGHLEELLQLSPMFNKYNYHLITEKTKSNMYLKDKYKDKVPTQKNKILAKSLASILIIAIISLILRYVNGYTTFIEGFGYGFLLWTIVNIYDAVVMDIIWFCHDPYFVFKGTEDMVDEYHNYWFHIKGSLIGEVLALVISAIVGLVIQFIL